MQVIETLAGSSNGLSLGTLADTLNVPKTSAMHLLRALEAAGYVRRTPSGFKLGASSYRLANSIPAPDDFEEAALEVMRELLAATQETILLGAFTADFSSCLYTLRLGSPQSVRFEPEIGERRPLYASGLGKVLLAYAGDAFLQSYVDSTPLKRITPRTTSSRAALRRQLDQVRAHGVSESIDELVEGGSALAAPVFEAGGVAKQALVIAAPTGRLLVHRVALISELRQAADQLSALRASSFRRYARTHRE